MSVSVVLSVSKNNGILSYIKKVIYGPPLLLAIGCFDV